jgi:hypothetical protein
VDVTDNAVRAHLMSLERGRTAAQEHLEHFTDKSRDQRIEFALNLLRISGGDAMGEESEGKYFIRGNGCQLSAATGSPPGGLPHSGSASL